MWETCPLPHPHMMITISSKTLLGKQAKAKHRFDGSESKVLESCRESKSRKTQPLISKFIAWLHASLSAEAAGFCILHGMYQIGLCIPHSRSLLPPSYPAAHSVQMASSAWKTPLTAGTLGAFRGSGAPLWVLGSQKASVWRCLQPPFRAPTHPGGCSFRVLSWLSPWCGSGP